MLIVGAGPWATGLARTFHDLGVPVAIADVNGAHLEQAREAGVETFRGEILSDLAEHRLEFNRFEHVLAATDDDAYNALVCTQLAAEFGHRNTFQLAGHETGAAGAGQVRMSARGRVLIAAGLDADTLEERLRQGWGFAIRKGAELGEELREALAQGEEPEPGEQSRELVVAALTGDGQVWMHAASQPLEITDDETVILFAANPGESDRSNSGAEVG